MGGELDQHADAQEVSRQAPRVGFVYTAVKAKFPSTLNDLGAPGLYGDYRRQRKHVDDLDTTRLDDRFQTQ